MPYSEDLVISSIRWARDSSFRSSAKTRLHNISPDPHGPTAGFGGMIVLRIFPI